MILLDANANGAKEYFHHDEATDTTTITTVQDVSGFLDKMKAKRNDIGDASLMNEEFWHYASIPAVVEIELRNKGINIYNPEHRKAMFQEINSNYPYLKTTNKKHA